MAARFPTTRWTRVIRAGDPADPGAITALEDLCRDYWFPLYAFVRRQGLSPDEAEDIVQGLFADLIERGDMASVDQSKGRFRSFLRAACEHYLANCRDHDRAAKRGGEVAMVSINRLDAECRYDREPAHELTAERLFEREWALHRAQARARAARRGVGRRRQGGVVRGPASRPAGRGSRLVLFRNRRQIGNERRSPPSRLRIGCGPATASCSVRRSAARPTTEPPSIRRSAI